MPLINEAVVQEARKVDLLTYLQNYEPHNLVHVAGNTYCTQEHDSLKISNGKWYWFSRGVGGVSALDYLIKVKGYNFRDAVELLTGREIEKKSPSFSNARKPETKELVLPAVEKYPYRAISYLKSRKIDQDIIDYCLEHSMIYETSNYHNVIFVGYDSKGIARYAATRGTQSSYKGEVPGSNKCFSFSITDNQDTERLHIFESAIDLMSYATLKLMNGENWKQDAMLSLAGVHKPGHAAVVPATLTQFLEDHPAVSVIYLHLDNDDVGRGAALGIKDALCDKYIVFDEPPVYGKDVNEYLIYEAEKRKEVPVR